MTINILGYIIIIKKDERNKAGTIADREIVTEEQREELEIKVDFDKATQTSDALDELLDFASLRNARKEFKAKSTVMGIA